MLASRRQRYAASRAKTALPGVLLPEFTAITDRRRGFT